MIRKRIIFLGCVQGVGFRWKSRNVADALGLTGWVRNEYDGSVQMEIQGDEILIERMLQSLNQDKYIDIQDMDAKGIPVDEEERTFKVEY